MACIKSGFLDYAFSVLAFFKIVEGLRVKSEALLVSPSNLHLCP